jgi:oligopeptide/dipeptide ABC transporter ATP-binding protein
MALLEINNLVVKFTTDARPLTAVDGINLSLGEGETLGLVGESGCGKSVTALAVLGLLPQPAGQVSGGRIYFNGQELLSLSQNEMRKIRGKDISMIFQELMTSLNPVFTVGNQVAEVYKVHQGLSGRAARDKVKEALSAVRIPDPDRIIGQYPHQLSGGMRQRVMIAMAMACNPRLLIADEPTTALDVTIQAQILWLMNQLKQESRTSILLITHDLGVVAEIADRVAVMYTGRLLEEAPVTDLFMKPMHPYTVNLLKSIPTLGKDEPLHTIQGTVPDMMNLPSGCKFRTRCPEVFEPCAGEEPGYLEITPNHLVRCYWFGHGYEK